MGNTIDGEEHWQVVGSCTPGSRWLSRVFLKSVDAGEIASDKFFKMKVGTS